MDECGRTRAGLVVSSQNVKGERAMARKNVVELTRGRLLSPTQEADEFVFEPGRRKPPQRVTVAPEDKILVSREEAAQLLSISQRGLDYLVASKRLPIRRIGGRVLIPVAELRKYARCDHPERIVS
jgi:excisionase family DNA binding protein